MATMVGKLRAASEVTPDTFFASGWTAAEKMSLPTLQSKMKCDPEGYATELNLIYSQFKSFQELFQQQAALNFTSVSGIAPDASIAKDLGDRVIFLAHVAPFYPTQLVDYPKELAQFLMSSARSLPSGLRVHVTQALILLINRQMVDIGTTIALFIELQTLGDRNLKKLAFSHVIHSIKRMNQKHKNEAKNRALQNILFAFLQQEDEAKAKRSLVTLCDLHRRRVWFDDRTANAICRACFHPSSRIMISTLSFLLDYEKLEEDDESDGSSSEDEKTSQQASIVVNKEAIYKATHKGTTSSKKKKKAKLQRAIRSMKKHQRISSQNTNSNYYSPLSHLKDAQGFAEKLYSRLQTCNERFEVKMMILKLIARTVGLHRLILLNFYPFIQKYVQPHQRDVTNLLAAAVQACHDMVPPDAVEPLFRQIVNQFVHDRSRPEAIAVGLNVVREICLRIPLLMTEDLLQDLVLYRKSHDKSVSSSARSLLTLFREIFPSLLAKKDRGRPTDPKARPKAFGETKAADNVPGLELLQGEIDDVDRDIMGADSDSSSDGHQQTINDNDADTCEGSDSDGYDSNGDDDLEDESDVAVESEDSVSGEDDYMGEVKVSEDEDSENDEIDSDMEEQISDKDDQCVEDTDCCKGSEDKLESKKRKFLDFDEQLHAADKSLRALKKKLAVSKTKGDSETLDGIFSDEFFQRIRELKAKKEARYALTQNGYKVPSSDQLSIKRVDAATLEANVRKKLSKEEKMALVRAGREERGKYQSRTAIKQKKTGGLSNRQKEHKKAMPLAAKRAKIAKSRTEKKKQQRRSGKQFRGRKAWK